MEFLKTIFSNSENKKITFALGAVLIVIIILTVVTYMFFYKEDSNNYDDLHFETSDTSAMNAIANPTQTNSTPNNAQSISAATPLENVEQASVMPDSSNNSTNTSNAPTATNTTSATNTINQLRYSIKPMNENIATCHIMRNGRWAMPESCENDVVKSVQNLINANNELIALEVSGIVDNSPYAGPSAELKQEGLASFRATQAIALITRHFSNVAVFEGLSIQAPDKRGFEIKAYYLQKP